MSYGKIDPKLLAVAQRAAEHTEDAVDAEAKRAATELRDATTPNPNERINQGVAWAVESYNGSTMEEVPADAPVTLEGVSQRVDRLEQTLKDMCRGQMLLDRKSQGLFK